MKSIYKRTVNILLTVCITLSSGASISAADASAAEDVCTQIGLESYDSRITVNSGSLSIEQPPYDTDNSISSEVLLGALSARRYELSYVDDELSGSESERVIGGYIRAAHLRDADNVQYIPIELYRGTEAAVTVGENTYFSSSGGSKKVMRKGVLGRDGEIAIACVIPPSGGNTAYDRIEQTLPLNGRTFTVEFSIYAEGDAALRLNHTTSGDACSLLTWHGDGGLYANDGGTLVSCGVLERSSWHKAAVTYDAQKNNLLIYIDGVLLTSGSDRQTGLSRLNLGIDTGSTSGFAAFADMKYYYGYYYPELYYKAGFDAHDTVMLKRDDSGALYAGLSCAAAQEKERWLAISQHDVSGRLIGAAVSDCETNGVTETHTARLEYNDSPRVRTKIMTFDDRDKLTPSGAARKLGNETVFDEDFESYGSTMIEAAQGNVMEVYTDTDNDHAMRLKRTDGNVSDFHITADCRFPYSDYGVYDFDIKLLEESSEIRIYLMDELKNSEMIADIKKGGSVVFGGVEFTLEPYIRHNIAAVYNYYDRTRSIYLDGTLVSENEVLTSDFAKKGTAQQLRFHTWNNPEPVDILIDNVRAYEGVQPRSEINAFEKIVDTDRSRTVFDSEASYVNMLDGFFAIHSRSGVFYKDGKKSLLSYPPYTEDGITYVNAAEICAGIGEAVAAGTDGGYIPIEELAAALDMTLYKNNSALNGGMSILGRQRFSAPTGSTLQGLNDYLFYLRPKERELRSAYAVSPQRGVHPRIHASKTAFDRARALYASKEEEYFNRWSLQLINYANRLVSYGRSRSFTEYIIDGGRLTEESRCLIDNMYTLGMAYQLTGDMRYVDRAWMELEAVSGFPNWNPSHHLDPCEMGLGVAVGYDWMYDAFTPEQRAVIEKGMYNNLFYDAANSYKSTLSMMTNSATATNNHNVVCNGGIAVAAMAMLDVYPEEAYYLLENAIRAVDLMMYHYAPNGAWYEGVGYWELATQYTIAMFSTMEATLGSIFALDKCEGLDIASRYMIYNQTDNGVFNTGDDDVSWLTSQLYVPEMIWMSQHYNDPVVTKAVLKYRPSALKNSGDNALGLLWYDGSVTDTDIDLPLDAYYEGDETVTMRNTWEIGSGTSYVGIHGGLTVAEHSQLDGGTFIFETLGERWAKDLGAGDYNCVGYWETDPNQAYNRWQYFRSRAESHNTIVIDPDHSKPDHNLSSRVDITRFETSGGSAIAAADLSGVLKDNASAAKRGFFYTDDRRSLVIRDEISLKAQSDVYWHMMTDASVTIDSDTAILTKNGKRLRLEFIAVGGEAELSAQPVSEILKAFPTDSKTDNENDEHNTRIEIKLCGSGDVSITVKLTPYEMEGVTAVEEYNIPISEWTLID